VVRRFKTNIGHAPRIHREGPSPSPSPIMISEFIPRVKRNEDLFRYLFPIGGVVKNLIISVIVRPGLEFFTINAYLHSGEGQDASCTQMALEMKPGLNPIDAVEIKVERGDQLRLDIEGIVEVYKEILEMGIAFTISPKDKV